MTTASLFPAAAEQHQPTPAADDAAPLFERQRAIVSAHQFTLTAIKPGQTVMSRIRNQHRGQLLRLDDPRAWAGSIKFPGTDEDNPPAQAEVTAHVASCIAQGLMTRHVPVAWCFGRVLWDSAEGLYKADA